MFSREMNPSLGRSGRIRPQLEILEDRCCPSGVSFQNHVLSLTGDSTTSSIVVQDKGNGTVFGEVIFSNGASRSYTAKAVSTININTNSIYNLKTHNAQVEHIHYDLKGALTTSETLNVNLGQGNDFVQMHFDQKISAKSLKINVDGGGGNPDVLATFANIDGTDLQLTARLGDYVNHFHNKWNAGSQFNAVFAGNETGKANVNVKVLGGDGVDNIHLNVNGGIATNAKMTISTSVLNNDNVINTDYTGKLDGSLTIQDQIGAGQDWLKSLINLAPNSTGSLDAHLHGGGTLRSVALTLKVTDSSGQLHNLDATIDGAPGHLSITRPASVKVPNPHH